MNPFGGTWISDSRPLEPVLGRKFHVESELLQRRKCLENEIEKAKVFNKISSFYCLF